LGLWSEAGAINGAPTEGAVVPDFAFVGGGFISPAIYTGSMIRMVDSGVWICGGRYEWAPTMGAYYIVSIMVGCGVPDLALCRGRIYQPRIYTDRIMDSRIVNMWRAPCKITNLI
jgi:hypothetical protein